MRLRDLRKLVEQMQGGGGSGWTGLEQTGPDLAFTTENEGADETETGSGKITVPGLTFAKKSNGPFLVWFESMVHGGAKFTLRSKDDVTPWTDLATTATDLDHLTQNYDAEAIPAERFWFFVGTGEKYKELGPDLVQPGDGARGGIAGAAFSVPDVDDGVTREFEVLVEHTGFNPFSGVEPTLVKKGKLAYADLGF